VITEGALNLIDADYLSQKTKRLEQSGLFKGPLLNPCIGVLIGGNSKRFSLGIEVIKDLAREIKKSAEALNADILISTSRRSSLEVEEAIKNEFSNYVRCKLLVIARQNNNPDVVGGILGSSSLIVSSPESISMISEAVCAEKYVVVFNSGNLSAKHQRFLKNYSNQGYIYLKQIKDLSAGINQLWRNKPQVSSPKDNLKVIEGLNKIL
jgi:mitochondrial fission protein ELM1